MMASMCCTTLIAAFVIGFSFVPRCGAVMLALEDLEHHSRELPKIIEPRSSCKAMILGSLFTKLPNAHWDRTIQLDGSFSKTPFGLKRSRQAGNSEQDVAAREATELSTMSATQMRDTMKSLVDSVAEAQKPPQDQEHHKNDSNNITTIMNNRSNNITTIMNNRSNNG
eukprot:TRINITY_DN2595_c0_g2_i2.p1 TRINITY_DN2595_c0_g2~~TRINITY_DN2595_c0_g2_i2.p1  ORF type:complete len:168 (+),score=44.91 TRINITY_DN2595_c0_g2_i2:72-575(+)